jgi:hypothetical protein
MYHLQNITQALATKIKEMKPMLNLEPCSVYELLFKTVAHSVKPELFPEVERHPLACTLTKDVENLVFNIDSLLRSRLGESSAHLKKTIEFIESARTSRRRLHIILCDAFSLPEYLFTIYEFAELTDASNALCSMNPSGKTATFKYLAKEYLGITPLGSREIVMRDVDEALRRKLGASSRNRPFRDIDNLIHYHKFETEGELIAALFKITSKLHKEIRSATNQRHDVLLIADHGYDFVRGINSWKLMHKWDKDQTCISPFVPLLLIGN